ncbi:GTP-binding protein [Streptomyces sp. NPDC050485]|uniref:GTP-binding protein n=1 Tax=Streptomyces sp. NPDC050485 TaxID=3365617 RepID=UPI0037890E4D
MQAYAACDQDPPRAHRPATLKVVIAGGFGAGKTTLVGAVSEIPPLTTEEQLTEAGQDIDSLTGVGAKTTTTVAMDFGRITFTAPTNLQLMLFGTPGQNRFKTLWDDLSYGAVGAVVLADTRRLADSFEAVSHFEQRAVPFVIAVNQFDGSDRYPLDEVRDSLDLDPGVPVVPCDARSRQSAVNVLIALVRHALTTAPGARP